MAVVYDTILSAIHNRLQSTVRCVGVVYDTILSAIHNISDEGTVKPKVVYDTILSAISKNDGAKINIMIEFTKNRCCFLGLFLQILLEISL